MFSSTGLSSFPLVLLLFFVWMIILLVLKRLGAGEVGCASGKPPMYPSLESIQVANHSIKPSPLDSVIHSEEEDPANGAKHRDEGIVEEHKEVEDIELWLFEVKVIARGIRRVRIIFLLCGFSIILGSVVLITAGFRVLDGALQTTMQNIQDTNDMIFDNLERINDLILTGQQAALVRSQATEELASWCPKAAENAWTLSSGNFPQILVSQEGEDKFSSLSLKNETNDLLKALEDLEDFLIPGSLRVEDSLVRARNHGIKIYETFDDTADWWFHFVVVFTIIFDALAITFMVGCCLAWTYRLPKCFERLQTYVILPSFCGILLMFCISVSGFAFALVLNADLCSGSPEENVVSIIQEKELEMDPLLFKMADYYVEGCTMDDKPEKPTDLFDNFLPFLESGIDFSQAVAETIASLGISNLSWACGANIRNIQNLLKYLLEALNAKKERTNNMIEGLYCSKVNPIFSKSMYGAICSDGVQAFTSIFISLFVITVAGMVMVSLRVAFHEVRNESNWVEELGLHVVYSGELEREDVIEEDFTEMGDDGCLHEA